LNLFDSNPGDLITDKSKQLSFIFVLSNLNDEMIFYFKLKAASYSYDS